MEGNVSGVGTEGGGSSVPEEGAGERGLEQPTTASDRGVERYEEHTWAGGRLALLLSASSRIATHSLCPLLLAIMRAVSPFYKGNGNEVKMKGIICICVLLPLTVTPLPPIFNIDYIIYMP